MLLEVVPKRDFLAASLTDAGSAAPEDSLSRMIAEDTNEEMKPNELYKSDRKAGCDESSCNDSIDHFCDVPLSSLFWRVARQHKPGEKQIDAR